MTKRFAKIKPVVKITSLFVLGALTVGGIFVSAKVMFWIKTAPALTKQALASDTSSQIYDKDDNVIWSSNVVDRQVIKFSDTSQNFRDALVDTEDKSFFKNSGVNWGATIKVAPGHLTGQTSRGASTLTQQLIKNSDFSTSAKDATLKRKVQEIFLAEALDKAYSKKQIFDFYINKVYMGHNVYGVGTAANYYYGKPLKELDLSQSAILAGLPQSPTQYDLYGNKQALEAVEWRRNIVLQSMLEEHSITKKEYRQAKAEPVTNGLVPQEQHEQDYLSQHQQLLKNQWFVQSVQEQVKKLGYNLNMGGLKVHTEFDPNVQDVLVDQINNNAALADMGDIQAAGTIVDSKTGAVIAQVGGRNVGQSLFGLNRATSTLRSSGSGIKPLIDYGPAIEYLGWGSNHKVLDAAYTYPGSNVVLGNASPGYHGNVTMSYALAMSLNTPAARTLDDYVGGARASAFLNKLQIPNHGAKTGGADAVGLNVSTAQMASGFAAVANNGIYNQTRYVTSITTPDGTEHSIPTNSVRAMSQATAYILTSMMKKVLDQGMTGQEAAISGLHQAVKTGTVGYADGDPVPNQAIKDLWVNGITKGLSFSLWVGYDKPLAQNGYIPYADYDLAHIVYRDVMSQVAFNYDNSDWQRPATVVNGADGLTPVNQDKTQEANVPTTPVWSDGDHVLKQTKKHEKSVKGKKEKVTTPSEWQFPTRNSAYDANSDSEVSSLNSTASSINKAMSDSNSAASSSAANRSSSATEPVSSSSSSN